MPYNYYTVTTLCSATLLHYYLPSDTHWTQCASEIVIVIIIVQLYLLSIEHLVEAMTGKAFEKIKDDDWNILPKIVYEMLLLFESC